MIEKKIVRKFPSFEVSRAELTGNVIGKKDGRLIFRIYHSLYYGDYILSIEEPNYVFGMIRHFRELFKGLERVV